MKQLTECFVQVLTGKFVLEVTWANQNLKYMKFITFNKHDSIVSSQYYQTSSPGLLLLFLQKRFVWTHRKQDHRL